MASDVYSLDELAQKVGIHPRTIRSYIQQGLLRGPESMGRNAHYTDYHLKRLEVIKTLKDDYALSLSEIRRLVTMADPDEDIKIASIMPSMMQDSAPLKGLPLFLAEKTEDSQSSALDFVRARQALAHEKTESDKESLRQDIRPQKSGRRRRRLISRSERRARVSPRLEQLLEQLKAISSGNAKRRTRGEDWIRLRITPDIEFHIRGQLSREQLACFEQLADTMRHILM